MALSAEEKIEKGKTAISAFAAYRAAKAAGNEADAEVAAKVLKDNVAYFGYGYIKDVNELVPNVPLTFYMFRVMVMLGGYFILFFIVVLFLAYKKDLSRMPWMHWVAMLTIPLGYLAGQAGWVVAECGRQPWAIRDLLPTSAGHPRYAAHECRHLQAGCRLRADHVLYLPGTFHCHADCRGGNYAEGHSQRSGNRNAHTVT